MDTKHLHKLTNTVWSRHERHIRDIQWECALHWPSVSNDVA